jgi:hypothetical protein
MQGGDAMMLTEAAVRDLARELGELVGEENLIVDDVRAAFDRLVAGGLTPVRTPFRLDAVRADSVVVRDPAGWMIRLVHCDPDSPDL